MKIEIDQQWLNKMFNMHPEATHKDVLNFYHRHIKGTDLESLILRNIGEYFIHQLGLEK